MAYVISDDCIACGTCIDECPSGAISEGEKYSIDTDVCVECGTCADVCPSEAILEQEISNNRYTNSSSKTKTKMANSVNILMLRNLCDEMGFRSKIDSDGDICLVLSADDDFGHDVCVFIRATEKSTYRIWGMAGFKVEQHNVGKVLLKLNDYNKSSLFMKAYLEESGLVIVERGELLDEEVSEEFIKANCIGMCITLIWNFFKDNFSDF